MQDAQVTKSLLNTFGEGFIIASIFLFTGRWAYNWGGGRALMTRGAYRVVSKGQGAFFPGYYKHDPHLLL